MLLTSPSLPADDILSWYSGWQLDLGWKADENPKELERDPKERYETRQRRIPPALVVR